METSWESELGQLLNDLLAVQDELLGTLSQKRELLKAADAEGLAEMASKEEKLIGSLQECMQRRQTLLAQADRQGLPSENIRVLTKALPDERRHSLDEQVHRAETQARLLRHHSLTNWVVIQRTVIHLSQMLEIIATGGRLQPTYGEGEPVNASGGLVDRAA